MRQAEDGEWDRSAPWVYETAAPAWVSELAAEPVDPRRLSRGIELDPEDQYYPSEDDFDDDLPDVGDGYIAPFTSPFETPLYDRPRYDRPGYAGPRPVRAGERPAPRTPGPVDGGRWDSPFDAPPSGSSSSRASSFGASGSPAIGSASVAGTSSDELASRRLRRTQPGGPERDDRARQGDPQAHRRDVPDPIADLYRPGPGDASSWSSSGSRSAGSRAPGSRTPGTRQPSDHRYPDRRDNGRDESERPDPDRRREQNRRDRFDDEFRRGRDPDLDLSGRDSPGRDPFDRDSTDSDRTDSDRTDRDRTDRDRDRGRRDASADRPATGRARVPQAPPAARAADPLTDGLLPDEPLRDNRQADRARAVSDVFDGYLFEGGRSGRRNPWIDDPIDREPDLGDQDDVPAWDSRTPWSGADGRRASQIEPERPAPIIAKAGPPIVDDPSVPRVTSTATPPAMPRVLKRAEPPPTPRVLSRSTQPPTPRVISAAPTTAVPKPADGPAPVTPAVGQPSSKPAGDLPRPVPAAGAGRVPAGRATPGRVVPEQTAADLTGADSNDSGRNDSDRNGSDRNAPDRSGSDWGGSDWGGSQRAGSDRSHPEWSVPDRTDSDRPVSGAAPAMPGRVGSDRAARGRAGQSRADQGRAGQDRAGQDRVEVGRVGTDGLGPTRVNAGHGSAMGEDAQVIPLRRRSAGRADDSLPTGRSAVAGPSDSEPGDERRTARGSAAVGSARVSPVGTTPGRDAADTPDTTAANPGSHAGAGSAVDAAGVWAAGTAATSTATSANATTGTATTGTATTGPEQPGHPATGSEAPRTAPTSGPPVSGGDALQDVIAPEDLLPTALMPGPAPTEHRPSADPVPDTPTDVAADAQDSPPDAPEEPAAELALAGIRWRLDGATLREVVDDRDDLRALGARLDQPLSASADNLSRARLLCLRAEVYRLLDELGMAAAASRLALAHAEAAADAQAMVIAQAELAHVLRLRRDFGEADTLFEEAACADVPELLRCVVHENAGRSCFDQGRYMEALDHFARAIRLGDPGDLDLVERIDVALEAVYIRVLRDGWGPYPRLRREILGLAPEEPEAPQLHHHQSPLPAQTDPQTDPHADQTHPQQPTRKDRQDQPAPPDDDTDETAHPYGTAGRVESDARPGSRVREQVRVAGEPVVPRQAGPAPTGDAAVSATEYARLPYPPAAATARVVVPQQQRPFPGASSPTAGPPTTPSMAGWPTAAPTPAGSSAAAPSMAASSRASTGQVERQHAPAYPAGVPVAVDRPAVAPQPRLAETAHPLPRRIASPPSPQPVAPRRAHAEPVADPSAQPGGPSARPGAPAAQPEASAAQPGASALRPGDAAVWLQSPGPHDAAPTSSGPPGPTQQNPAPPSATPHGSAPESPAPQSPAPQSPAPQSPAPQSPAPQWVELELRDPTPPAVEVDWFAAAQRPPAQR
jgi:hypothetical protein